MEMPRIGTRSTNKDVRPAHKYGLDKKVRAEQQKARDDKKAAKEKAQAKAAGKDKKNLEDLAAFEDKQREQDIADAETVNRPADRPLKPRPPPEKGADTAVIGGADIAPKARTPAEEDVDMAVIGGAAIAPKTLTPAEEDVDMGSARPLKPRTPAKEDGDLPAGAAAGHSSGYDSDAFKPNGKDSSSEESELEPELDNSDEEPASPKPKKKKHRKSTSRADIRASRTTQDSTGTPATPSEEDNGKKRKATEKTSETKKKAKIIKKKAGLDKKAVKKSKGPAGNEADDDSMVAPGGPALDDDLDEEVERPKKGKKQKGVPAAPPLIIQPIAAKAPTRKALRNGAATWNLNHLPRGTSDEFTSEVIPLVRELAGAVPPWAALNVEQIQGVVDRVYGKGKHTVTLEGPWYGLVSYRMNDWHNKFAAQALKGMDVLVESYGVKAGDGSDSELSGGEESDVHPVTPTAPAPDPVSAAAENTTDDSVTNAPKPFVLDTPEGVRDFVKWALQRHDNGTMAFQWKTWGNGIDKKGFLQSHLIRYTFAYHLSCLAAIPGSYPRSQAPAIGALLLSMQAVEHALNLWKTGVYVNTHGNSTHFSVENWGDCVGPADQRTGERKLVRRATKYVTTVQKWKKEQQWDELITAASEFVEVGRKRGAASRSASEASGDELVPEEDVIILSD
ncbi:hypothetical protein FB451DRAFT_1369850 [Mycena latifolia]|nr:hypothetical protein FB451DRAFT_1369850 [Mycena latifolia]